MPLFDSGPWKPFGLVALLWVLSLTWGKPKKPARGAQPFLFLFYCIMSGLFGAGTVVGSMLFGSIDKGWKCTNLTTWANMGFFGVMRVYLGYVAIWLKLFQTVEAVVLRKSALKVLLHSFEVFVCYITFKHNNYDNMASAIVGHCLLVSFHYYYKAVEVSGTESKSMMASKSTVITGLTLFQSLYMILQALNFMNNKACMVSTQLAVIEAMCGAVLLVFSNYLYVQ